MKDSSNGKKPYEAPHLTVVTFKTERGYAASGVLSELMFWDNAQDAHNMENYETQENWHSGGEFWG